MQTKKYLFALGLFAVMATGCVTQKQMTYLQDADSSKADSINRVFRAQSETVIRKGDALTITVNALDKEAVVDQFVRENGKEALLELKKNHHNLKLEDFVVGADQGRMLDIVDGHIVPRVGPIFLTPHNQMGRAPFYSSEKIVAGIHVKTLWFNMGIIFLMCIVATILLMADWPGRIIRKESSTQ
jgi:hypothetical protein